MAKRAPQCSFREGARRCPFPGTGDPLLCAAHRIALAEAARPKSPAEVLSDALNNFLAGKPVNVGATIGAADEIFGRWAMGGGIADGYHPDVEPGESESSAHRRAQPGAQRGVPWWHAAARPQQQPPPPPDPLSEERRRARQVLGFAPSEVLTEQAIRKAQRTLAKRHHPDRGGSVDRMAAINHAADVLMQSL